MCRNGQAADREIERLEQELEKKRRVIAEVVEENLEMDDAEDGGRGLRMPLGTAIHGPVTVQLTGGA